MTEEKAYVLGTDDDEIVRLGVQHRVWRRRALEAWRSAGFTSGQNLVDLGCGPGYATIDLAEIVGATGSVTSMDQSSRFLHWLEAKAVERKLLNIKTLELDLERGTFPSMKADGVWVRWVFAFMRDRKALLSRIRGLLKDGGKLAVHEYVDYATWQMAPASEAFDRFVAAVVTSWRDSGGEPDTGLELLGWLDEAGFTVQSVRPIVDIITPRDFTWQWPKAFVATGINHMLELGLMSRTAADEVRALLAACEESGDGFMMTPTVVEIVAVAT